MLNVDRAERRKSARTLSAIQAAFSDELDHAWFEATHDSHEEAELAKAMYRVRSKVATDPPITETD